MKNLKRFEELNEIFGIGKNPTGDDGARYNHVVNQLLKAFGWLELPNMPWGVLEEKTRMAIITECMDYCLDKHSKVEANSPKMFNEEDIEVAKKYRKHLIEDLEWSYRSHHTEQRPEPQVNPGEGQTHQSHEAH